MTGTRASRIGLLVAIFGTGLVIYHLYTFKPRDNQRPESPQHRELVLQLERQADERARKALANALAGEAAADCAPNDDACFAQKHLDEMGLSTSAADLWATWTPSSYIRAWKGNTIAAARHSRSFQVSMGLLVLGLYLLMLHEATLGRLAKWVMHGNQT